jgi:hypothetical protein
MGYFKNQLDYSPPAVQTVPTNPHAISLHFTKRDLDAAYAQAYRSSKPEWHRAIDKAYDRLKGNMWSFDGHVVTLHSASSTERYRIAITEPMTCQCRAHQLGNPCWHVAAARLCVRAGQHRTTMDNCAAILNRNRPAMAQAAVDELF